MKKLFVLLFLLSSVSLFAQHPIDRNWETDDFARAMDLFNKEKFTPAQKIFDCLASSPNASVAPSAQYYAAVCAQQLNNDDAETRLAAFLQNCPQSSHVNMAHFYLGNFYYGRKDYPKAQNQYAQVDGKDVAPSHHAELDFKNGYCLFQAGLNAQAKKCFAQVVGGKSKYRNAALYYYAHIQYVDGDYELSLENFEKLQRDRAFAKIVPSYVARLYYYLGREEDLLQMAPALLMEEDVVKKNEIRCMVAEVYYNRGDYPNALMYYSAAEASQADNMPATSPDNSQPVANSTLACTPQDCYYQMGYCYYMTHQYDSAARYLERKTACVDSVAQNALYTLGDVYVHLGRKDDARSMYLQASKMNFDPRIQEDALFNYAKLSCELRLNPYNESIRSFQDYLQTYPKTSHRSEIQEILASLYLTTRNYKDALVLIEKIPDRNAKLNQAYQNIVLNRGLELFNAGNIAEASSYFVKAVQINALPRVTADAYYLNGECQYRQNKIESAARSFDKFLLSSYAPQSIYYPQALYTHGYLCMKQQHYGDAITSFRKFLTAGKGKVDDHQLADANNRLGDCKFVSRSYYEAIPYYEAVIKADDPDADYATFQKAMSYGALGKYTDKLNLLDHLFSQYPNSTITPKALLEVANTYLICDNNEQALQYYNSFVKRYPQSALAKEALLDMGLIYYNDGQLDQALASFDKLLTNYSGTPEARDALSTIKNIYIAQNRVDEYFSYVKRTAKITVSTVEQDSTTYLAAEDRYLEGDYVNAATGFEKYLKKFPNGLFALQAHYYAADAYFTTGQSAQALPHYQAVASAPNNKFTERALTNAAGIAFGQENYTLALDFNQRLVAASESSTGRLQGRVGVMRCWQRLGDLDKLCAAADSLLAEQKVTPDLADEALLNKARSRYTQQRFADADELYARLLNSSNGEYSGEAAYCRAEILFNKKQLKAAEAAIENIAANPTSDYWLAKAFILWADIYYARGNNLQAKQTLQSIIDNYDGEDLVNLALQKRNAILTAEAAVQQPEEEEVIIEI